MREFEKWEIFKQKCYMCGCKNKIHTELLDPKRKFHVGYMLKCCACGKTDTFFNEHESNGHQGTPDYVFGQQRCLQPSFCPHKDCELYGKRYKPVPDKQPVHPSHKCDCDCIRYGKVVYNIVEGPKFL